MARINSGLTGGIVLLVLAFPNHLVSSIPTPSEPAKPTSTERAVLAGLEQWVSGKPTAGVAAPARPWSRSFRQNRESFELFTEYHDDSSRRAVVKRLPYGSLIQEAAERNGLDPLLVAAVVEVESRFSPSLSSDRGALGLMQVMPATAGELDPERLLDPRVNLEVGSAYLTYLLGRFGGDLELALAAYNAGPGRVGRFGGVPPYDETKTFVERVLGNYVKYQQQVWKSSGAMAHFAVDDTAATP